MGGGASAGRAMLGGDRAVTPAMSIISILVVLVLAGLVLWACNQFPLDATIVRIIRVVVVVAVILWLLQAFGLLGGTGLRV